MTLKLKQVTTTGMRGTASIPFPSNVVGALPITVTKEGGVYTIGIAPDTSVAADLIRINDTNVSLTLSGTPVGALLKSVTVTAGWTGTLSLARGGLGGSQSAATAGQVPVYPGSGGAAGPGV